ncbi:unnamed protein product [Penicillium pancosmium]
MSAQLDTAGSSNFLDVLYEVEPPNNIRRHEPGHDTNTVADNVALQIQITGREGDSLSQTRFPGSLPTTAHDIQQALGGPAADYQAVWESSAGGVAGLQEPSRFLMQTPQDSGDLSWSFGASVANGTGDRRVFKGILMYSGSGFIDPLLYPWHIPNEWESTDLPLVVVPLTLLRLHVDQTSAKLAELIRRVEDVEREVLNSSGIAEFDLLIRALHACDADLIKLERRWHFERNLAAAVLELSFQGCTISPTDNAHINFNLANSSFERMDASSIPNTKPFKLLDSIAVLQEQRSQAFEYDLGVLPRRIHNQFTAVYNLVAQRDARATHGLARDSSKIAEATLRDSSSMKTIAAMTLIFLPATFVCYVLL